MKPFASIYLLFVFFLIVACNLKNSPEVFDLRCESLQNPLGIDKTTPRFSWKISSKRNGTEQKAFQILVAGELSELTGGKADLWNSGKVESSASIFVPYQGQKLNSGTSAWWKVRVWDEAGNVSGWSEPARFSVGLLAENDWQAAYIAFNTEKGYRECPQLYSTFEVDETDFNYFLHVNSLGYHEVFLNGEKVGSGVLTPAVSQFDKRSLIITYDVSSLLKKGENQIMLWLGSGWYTEGLPGVVNDGPVVRAQLEKVENNQREVILATDENWQGRISSYTRYGNWRSDRFGGEIVNGSLTKNDLAIENTENPWQPVLMVDIPEHTVSPQMTEQNAITDTISPVSIREIAPDTFLVDMGKNLTGWVEFHFSNLQKNQEIKLDYCDHLIDGERFNDRNQYDTYIASGVSPEMFINKFNYHGFRYIRITGLKEKPPVESIKAYLIHTNFEPAATFECSDPDLNAIHDMLSYTLQCLSIGGDFVDCPQIERLGYGGDGNASTLTAQIMYNLAPVYNNWLQAWADVIREDGGMPHTAPNPYPAGGGPYWCGFIITASWNTYLNYGDTLVLEKYYPVMQKWLGYVDKYTKDGLLKRWPDTDYRGWYLGDWATPEGIDQTDEASVDLVNNSFIAVCYEKMEHIAAVLEKPGDARLYASKKQQLQEKIHDTFFNESTNTYATGTQIDLAFPMIAGVVPEDRMDAVKNSLYHETEVIRNGHLAAGLVGLPVLTEWVVKNGAVDLMYAMLKKRDYPGYLYMIDNGATTTWEHWNGARSHIHNCYNGIGSWFYQAVGGIRPAENVPAYRKVLIHPQIPDGVSWANTMQETPFGKLVVNWSLAGEMLELDIEIPVGVEAEVILPDSVNHYKMDGKAYELSENEENRVDLKSGKYKISSILQKNWIDSDTLVAQTLIIDEKEKQRLIELEKEGVLTIRPVALPRGKYLKGKNRHLGWPVGVKAGNTLLCAYHQQIKHHGPGPSGDQRSSNAVIVRSTDGGETWSDPLDIQQFGVNDKDMVLGFGNCFGVLDEKVFLASRYGLYKSENEGKTWQLIPGALTQKQTGHEYTDNFGPRMIIHPDKGLVIPVGVARSPFLDMYNSTDEGMTWHHERIQLSDSIHPLEPTGFYHKGHLIFLSRNHTLPFQWHQTLDKTQRPVMMVSSTGWFPMQHKAITNISGFRWPDTSDLDYNPVTKRYEAVVTNRSGGVLENERNEENEQTVNLWSIDPEDLYSGRASAWRFEATLLRLKSGMLNITAEDIDAAHPGGAVIDPERGVQHIFIYCGKYATPAGIYRITRTLNTPGLREASNNGANISSF